MILRASRTPQLSTIPQIALLLGQKLVSLWRAGFPNPWNRLRERRLEACVRAGVLPQHIGVIMDGNRRYARRVGLGNTDSGHALGASKLEEVLQWCGQLNIRLLTVWGFSLENFQRSPEEVSELMSLFESRFRDLRTHKELHRRGVRVRAIGRLGTLPLSLQKAIAEAEAATQHYDRYVLSIGVGYSGREEIVDAVCAHLRKQARAGQSLEDVAQHLSTEDLADHLYTTPLPEPDLIIRTSGEMRHSGFLLWQSAYTEFHFCSRPWPAFRKIDFLHALADYAQRKRRFGR